MTSEFTRIGGQPFHLRRWGDPGLPKLLLLHGFPEYSGAWDGLARRLSDRFHCIAPDQRGYGQSWAPDAVEDYRVGLLVQDMAALIEQEGAPIHVMGHDWGAAVAYGLAILRPDLVRRLIIANGVHPGPFQRACAAGGAQTTASQYMLALRREGSEEHFGANSFARLKTLFAEGMDFSWMTPELQTAYEAEWARPGRLRGMINWYRASPVKLGQPGEVLNIPELPVERGYVPMPHLLIWGAGDRALLPEATEGLEAYCADLTRIEIPGADHWIIHQKTDAVAEAVRAFLG